MQNPVSLGDAICDAHGIDDTNIGSATPDVIAIKTIGDTHHDDDTNMNSVPLGVNEIQSEAYIVFLYKRIGWLHPASIRLLIIMLMNHLLNVMVRYWMILITIISIQLVLVFNLKYQMMYVVIPKHFLKMSRQLLEIFPYHYNDIILGAIASQITSLTIVYSTVYSDADHRKHQSPASLAFVRGIHRWPANFPHKGPVTFDDVIMVLLIWISYWTKWVTVTYRIAIIMSCSVIAPIIWVIFVAIKLISTSWPWIT